MFKSIFAIIVMLTSFAVSANQCVDTRIKLFQKQHGMDTPIHLEVLDEWKSECGVSDEPREIDLKVGSGGSQIIYLQTREDYLIVTDIELNRGNCVLRPSSKPPFELKFGEVKSILTRNDCELIELKLEVDNFTYTWEFD